MNKKISPRSIHCSPPFNVEDVCYIPLGFGREKGRVNNMNDPEIQEIIKYVKPKWQTPQSILVEQALKQDYLHHIIVNEKEEPSWMKSVNSALKREIRIHTRIMEAAMAVPVLPFAGFGYVIEEDGLIHDISNAFGIWRLEGIRQLAFLHDPSVRENNPEIIAQHFNHTRFVHSLDVTAVMGLLIYNNRNAPVNGKTLWDYRYHALTAAMSHDTLTPAGGDTIKALDFEAFDEDKQYHTLFKKEGWPSVRDKYKLNEDLLYATVQGKGILGKLLDVADKIAYTSRDTWAFLNTLHIQSMENPVDLSYSLMEISNEVSDSPLITSLWSNALVQDEKVVFDDTDAVVNFLKLRARMFKGVYANPTSRFPEYLISQFIGRKMYEKGILTKEFLLSSKDEQLEDRINEFVGIPYFTHTTMAHIPVKIISFAKEDEAMAEKSKFNGYVSFIEKCESRTKTGVDSFLVFKEGKVMSVREAVPFQSEVVDSIMREDTSYRLYVLDLSKLTKDIQTKIIDLCKE